MIKIRTPFEQAEPAGKKLLAKATEEHFKRREDGKKSSYQACKEAATYLVNRSKGKVSFINSSSYNCFECTLKLKPLCKLCRDGFYFTKKGQ